MHVAVVAVVVALLCLQGCTAITQPRYIEGVNGNLGEALQFLRELDREAANMCFRVTSAQWAFSTNVTEPNRRRMLAEMALEGKLQRLSWRKATSFAWTTLPDPLARRQLRMLAIAGRAALPEDKAAELQQLIVDMKEVNANARVCPYNRPRTAGYCDLQLEPDLSETMSRSTDPAELEHVWRTWRDAVGPPTRAKFIRYVHLANQAARLNGFEDAGHQQRAAFEVDDLEQQVSDAWAAAAPLYAQLHAHVRRRLAQAHGKGIMRVDGPIPAHLLGNMWGQNWKALEDLARPFPRPVVAKDDGTREMLRQGYTPLRMFQLGEEFFTSMGMKPLPPEFWQHSMLERPLDREVVCKPSAWDFCNHKDYRVKHCTSVRGSDLATVHHELAHVQYYLQYAGQPQLFRAGADPSTHEAVADAIGLSVASPRHLHRLGLAAGNATQDYEAAIEFLMGQALEKVAYLPFAYLVDQWRWGVYRGSWPVSEMNSAWWELRLRHQGVVPPVTRADRDFDPASKYHIPADMPYMRYFVSLIAQFQIHEALCLAAGHVGPLHTCDIHRSREAGRLLTEALSAGASRPWSTLLRSLTRGKTDKLDARPLLEYFRPLHAWLTSQSREPGAVAAGWSTTAQDTALFARWSRDSSPAFAPSCLLVVMAAVAVATLAN